MIRLNGSYMYQVGFTLHPLQSVNTTWTNGQLYGVTFNAERWLDILLNNSLYKLQTAFASGQELLATLKEVNVKLMSDDIEFGDK
ncbi:MAG TPA: hypothetical protein VEV21_01045, partial [Burkholderiales bacterium]|nr:hypothetical protein [Burkholderiales bacterium]